MAATADYLNNLVTQRNALADNLVAKGVEATHDELFDTLVPKVLEIKGGGSASGNGIFPIDENGLPVDDVIIPEGVTALDNSGNTKNGFYYNQRVTSVKLPNSLTYLGQNAFYECNLSSINMPIGITALGKSCFHQCRYLASINIPPKVISIGDSCFYGCVNLEEVIIPDQVASIGNYCFGNCTELKRVIFQLDSPLTILPPSAFYQCSMLSEITFPSNLKEIGNQCFLGCKNLQRVVLPPTVTKLGVSSFRGCTSVTHFYLPSSLTSVNAMNGSANNTFCECSNVETVELGENFNCTISFSYCTKLTNAAEMLTKLKDLTGEATKIITFAKAVYDTLTADEIAVATAKNWTVASYG